jgi:type I restriction enzyme S subunit
VTPTGTNGLPSGWLIASLGDICARPEYGWTTSASETGSLRLLRTTDITKDILDWARVPFCETSPPNLLRFLLAPGDIVISRAGSVGVSALINECPNAVFASYLIRFRPLNGMNRQYVAFFLQSPDYWRAISVSASGIALQNVNAKKLAAIQMPLAPFREQSAIVEEIEKQFTRLDAAVAALKRVHANLKRYRAAVLKAACDGRLVPTEAELAQREGRSYEPASELLKRILLERRARWEADQFSRFHSSGRVLQDEKWKLRYREPGRFEDSKFSDPPEGWVIVSLGQVAWSVKDGPHYSPKYVDNGIPFVTGGQVRPSGVDFDAAKRISDELHVELSKRCRPEAGDLLYTKGGTTGIARVNTYDREFSVWVHVAVLKLVPSMIAFYLQHALNSPGCYAQAKRFTHGVGNQDLGLTRMVRITFGLPPIAEQRRIVAEVDRRMSVLDEIEQELTVSMKRAERLRQSILRQAFQGKLVPQDPSDEPAGLLLERIRAQREASQPLKKIGRRPRKMTAK